MLLPFIKGISRKVFELQVEDLKPHQKVDILKVRPNLLEKTLPNLQIHENPMIFYTILRDISGIF